MAKHRANTVRTVVLSALPASQAEIRAATSISQAAVSRWLAYLRDCNDAHIGAWRKAADKYSQPIAVYHPGHGVDAPCPVMTQKQLDRRSRAMRRKSGDWIDRQARERARYWAAKPARRDALTAALFGRA